MHFFSRLVLVSVGGSVAGAHVTSNELVDHTAKKHLRVHHNKNKEIMDSSNSSPNEPIESHRREGEAIDPPNAEAATYSVNIFFGRTPEEQRLALQGSELFNLSGSRGTKNGYRQYSQFSDMSASVSCTQSTFSNGVHWATSSYSLHSESESSSHGFAAESTIGLSAPVGAAEVSAETTVRNALVFGNSNTMTNSWEEVKRGRTYSMEASASRQLYSVEVDYSSLEDSWTSSFMDACAALSDDPTDLAVLQFMRDYGTHGLATAAFGQKCTSSLYMEEGYMSSAYQEFFQDTSEYEAGFLWWSSSGSSSTTDITATSEEQGFQYSIGNRRCHGEIALNSACGDQQMIGTGRDAPAIIKWTYKPIWEMNVPTLSAEAKNMLQSVAKRILAESTNCMNDHCNGSGSCAPNPDAWQAPSTNYGDYFDQNEQCFCFDHYEGKNCEERKVIIRASDADLYMHTWGGSKDPNNIRLHGNRAYADSHRNSQYRLIKYGENYLICATDADLCMHTYGGTKEANYIRLHGNMEYAKTHSNSQYRLVKHNQYYLICASEEGKDLCMHSWGGSKEKSYIQLHGGLSYARQKPNSQYLIVDNDVTSF